MESLAILTVSSQAAEQPPENCGQIIQIEQSGVDIPITPGVLNCFFCSFSVSFWQMELAEPLTSERGTYLLIDMPESYVQPGPTGRRTITCFGTVGEQRFQARLFSPGKTI
jgi:hypothetical protein